MSRSEADELLNRLDRARKLSERTEMIADAIVLVADVVADVVQEIVTLSQPEGR